MLDKQWHYEQINLPKAWDISKGSADVVVAVLDTGIHADHPELENQVTADGYDFIKDSTNAGDGIFLVELTVILPIIQRVFPMVLMFPEPLSQPVIMMQEFPVSHGIVVCYPSGC